MRQSAILALVLAGCASKALTGSDASHSSSDGAAPPADVISSPSDLGSTSSDAGASSSDVAPACTPKASQYNAPTQVEHARAQPPWVEMAITVLFPDPPFDWQHFGMTAGDERQQLVAQRMADLAPVQDDLEARLRAVGARQIVRFWLSPSISAIVPAGAVPQLPCWPFVTDVQGDALLAGLTDPCLTNAACDGMCSKALGDRIDVAGGCAHHGVPVVCRGTAPNFGDAPLNCYVETATGAVFTLQNPWLVELGDKAVHKCTPAEGGPTAPSLLPECP